tara:strand:+ start:362 stop:547 length:186 start_codon:yes stop_codon:yes gene_type:complete
MDGNSEILESALILHYLMLSKTISLDSMCKAFGFKYEVNCAGCEMHDWRKIDSFGACILIA